MPGPDRRMGRAGIAARATVATFGLPVAVAATGRPAGRTLRVVDPGSRQEGRPADRRVRRHGIASGRRPVPRGAGDNRLVALTLARPRAPA